MFFQTMINKDEKINTSPPYIGFLIIKKIDKVKEKRLALDEIVDFLKKEIGTISYRQLLFSLIFLYQSGIVNFVGHYIYKK
jgi:hypothetical protein